MPNRLCIQIARDDGLNLYLANKQQVVFQPPVFIINGDSAGFLVSGGFVRDSLFVGLFAAVPNEAVLKSGGDKSPQMERTTWDVS